jgi:hypothetical protein
MIVLYEARLNFIAEVAYVIIYVLRHELLII